MKKNILEIKNLKKTYRDSDFKLDDITFNVPYGSILGLIGENGSGKTTILNLILNLRKKDSGTISLFNEFLHDADKNVDWKEKIGVCFDTDCFPENLTANDLSKIYKRIYKKWDEKLYFSLLKKFSIKKDKKISGYSKGMKKTLSILTALSYHPQLLIFDEPTSSIDPVRREELLDLFLDFVENESNSIIFSSHITTDIERVADYVSFIHNGKSLITEVKDTLIYEYGIIRCGFSEFKKLDKEKIISFLKRDYEYTVLVSDQRIYSVNSNIIIENPSLEEIAYLLSRGERL